MFLIYKNVYRDPDKNVKGYSFGLVLRYETNFVHLWLRSLKCLRYTDRDNKEKKKGEGLYKNVVIGTVNIECRLRL